MSDRVTEAMRSGLAAVRRSASGSAAVDPARNAGTEPNPAASTSGSGTPAPTTPAPPGPAGTPGSAATAPPTSLPVQAMPPAPHRTRLYEMSPIRIGFTGTIGALTAFGLSQALIQARSVLILIVVAMFIALGLNPLVEMLTRRRVKRGLAVLIVFVAVIVVIGLAGVAVVPVFTEQITTLVNTAPDTLQSLKDNPQIAALDDRFQLISKATDFLTSGSLVSQLFGGLLGAGKVVLSAVFSGVTLLILTLYFLASLPTIKLAIYRLAPASRRARVGGLADKIFSRIGAYLSGMFVVVLTAGICSFIFLWIIGLREYALALAVVVAILDFIPMVGATIAAVVVCIVAFVQSPTAGIAAVIFYLVYQQFENYVVQPRVMKASVDVPGAVVVIAALLGGALLGVVGALLAVPTAAAILILLREVVNPKLDTS